MKIYEKIISGNRDESKPISMKYIVPYLPHRTESDKIKNNVRVKCSTENVQFIDDFPLSMCDCVCVCVCVLENCWWSMGHIACQLS